MNRLVVVGSVAYDSRVVPIWEGMREYFRMTGPPIDYVLYSNYDSQVQALLDRHIDIAWNTNLAWAKVHSRTGGTCQALAMRDVDARFRSVFVARADSGVRSLADVRGKSLALGSADSVQAAILPIHFLQLAGVDPDRDCKLIRFDTDVGKHGDTGTSELQVIQALQEGRAAVGALAESTWTRQSAADSAGLHNMQVVWTTPGYCHCVFTALAEFPTEMARQWTGSLLAMRHEDPRWGPLMDMEGVMKWIAADPATLEGYQFLYDAVQRQGLSARWK